MKLSFFLFFNERKEKFLTFQRLTFSSCNFWSDYIFALAVKATALVLQISFNLQFI